MWEEKHLPAVTKASTINNSTGYNISERREQLLEELEIAHIYIEQLSNIIDELKAEDNDIKARLQVLEQ